MINFIKNLFKKTYPGTGALPDTRPDSEREKDYQFKEIVASADPVNWVEKPQSAWRKFPIFNQNGSGSCVAQTMAKLLGIMYFLKNQLYVHFSATHIYQRRSNKPAGGMAAVDAFDIARKGVTLEELVPSQSMTDPQMDGISIPDYKQKVGEVFKIGNYVILPIQDIDTIASVIQKTNKGVMVWYFFEYAEWENVPSIKNLNLTALSGTAVRHSVTAVDFTLYQGKKALIIEDSWGPNFGVGGQRVITEDFHKSRNLFAAYPITFQFEEQSTPTKPQYTFTKELKFGQTNNDIKSLQDILKYEGLFPINTESTGYYGSITAKAILAWQKKHQVASDAELDQLAGKVVGPKTIEKLNQLYA